MRQELSQLEGFMVLYPDLGAALRELKFLRETKANLASADQLGRDTIDKAAKQAGKHSMAYATILNSVASTLRLEGQTKLAVEMQKTSLRINQDLQEPDDITNVERLNGLGHDLVEDGQLDEAKKVFAQALAIGERNKAYMAQGSPYGKPGYRPGPGSPARPNQTTTAGELCKTYNGFASIYLKMNKPNEALKELDKAYDMSRNDSGTDLVPLICNSALAYSQLGKSKEAIEDLNDGLSQLTRNGKDKYPDAELLWTQLGDVYYQAKENSNAEKCFEKALKLRTQFDWNHPRTRLVLANLIKVKKALGENDEAVALQAKLTLFHK